MTRLAGRFLVVAGTDGAGKTAIAEALIATALAPPILHLHHRPALLPARTEHDGPVTDPHAHQPYSPAVSAAKLLYLWIDYVAGWLVRVRPVLARGGCVVLERGWWDLAVDPRRYRLAPLPRLVRVLSAVLPRPDATVVLTAHPDVLLARKQELPLQELERQQTAWRGAPARSMRPVFVDAGKPLPDVVDEVTRALGSVGR